MKASARLLLAGLAAAVVVGLPRLLSPNTVDTGAASSILPPHWAFRPLNAFIDRLPVLYSRLVPPHLYTLLVAQAFIQSKALFVVTKMGVAEVLHREGPLPVAELAAWVGADPDRLQRLLRAVMGLGIFVETKPGVVGNNAASGVLRADHPSSVKDMVTVLGGFSYDGHARMLEAVKAGERRAAWELWSGGMPFWDWLAQPEHEEEQAAFNRAMESQNILADQALLADYDWGQHRGATVADIGGGTGGWLFSLLSAYPHLKGLLMDRPAVIAEAEAKWRRERASLAERVTFVPGDFFASAPQADVYFLRAILHDWNNTAATSILRTLRSAVRPNLAGDTTLLVADIVMPDQPSSGWIQASLDLQMLAIPGGRERSLPEWRMLLEAGGWRLVRTHPLRTLASMMVAVPEQKFDASKERQAGEN